MKTLPPVLLSVGFIIACFLMASSLVKNNPAHIEINNQKILVEVPRNNQEKALTSFLFSMIVLKEDRQAEEEAIRS